jgi:DNA-directed RNA polymerase subunit M/transcription elongation factor TFIIS
MAWEWTCDNCGRDNFCRSIVADANQIDEALRHNDMTEDEIEDGQFQMQPTTVKCQHCGTEYDVA